MAGEILAPLTIQISSARPRTTPSVATMFLLEGIPVDALRFWQSSDVTKQALQRAGERDEQQRGISLPGKPAQPGVSRCTVLASSNYFHVPALLLFQRKKAR